MKIMCLAFHNRIQRHRSACPFCDSKSLVVVRNGVKVESYAEEDMPPVWMPDIFLKCPKCKNQIGIRVINRSNVAC